MEMEEWSYNEIKCYVSESFDNILKFQPSIEVAAGSVVYEYEKVIESNVKEGIMIYTATFKYLESRGERLEWLDSVLSNLYRQSLPIKDIDEDSVGDIEEVRKLLISSFEK